MRKVSKAVCALLLVMALITGMCTSAFAASKSNEVSDRERTNAQLSREVAGQGMVLLENRNNVLPLSGADKKVALFGSGATQTVKGGTGSGDVNQRYVISVKQGLLNAHFTITSGSWLDAYDKAYAAGKANWQGGMWGSFSYPDPEITDEQFAEAKAADTAIYVIARNSGEGADRDSGKGDYLLTDNEYNNLKKLGAGFKNVIVLLNVGGVIDTKFFQEIPGLDALLLISQPGMEAGNAVADVLTGAVTPSGKLTDTWAKNYSDYSSSVTFSSNDRNVQQEEYKEGIYVGYRYFDTFNVTPQYEFGYGKSYTTFSTSIDSVTANANKVTVQATVTNTGTTYSGKEVVQVYFSAPKGSLEKPYQELAGYAKTDLLAPGQKQTLTISYNTTEMSSYDESTASYIMEKGDYLIRVGNSSRNTHVGAVVRLGDTAVTEKLSNLLVPQASLDELSAANAKPYSYSTESMEIRTAKVIALNPDDIVTKDDSSPYTDQSVTTYEVNGQVKDSAQFTGDDYEITKTVDQKSGLTLKDVYDGKATMQEFVAQMSVKQLANLANGIGFSFGGTNVPIIGGQSNSVPGAAGETTSLYKDSGIPNIILSDGPAGIRITQSFTGQDQSGAKDTYYQFCTAWPIGTLLAMTWDVDLLKKVGNAIGTEMTEYGVTLWLAPGMNIHRNPLCGRNFEYFSEDPLIAGLCGSAETLGVQSHPGIGVTIKHFATNNQENNRSSESNIISERALREIYLKGFEITVKSAQPMAIMTAYNKINGTYCASNYDLCTNLTRGEWKFKGLIMTDWGSQADAGLSMHAGNDLIMPGGSQNTIVSAATRVEPQFNPDGTILVNTVSSWYGPQKVEQWNDFVPDKNPDGSYVKTVQNGHTTYSGHYKDDYITKGDIQKSVMNILNIVMQSTQFAKMYGINAKPYSQQFKLSTYVGTVKSGVSPVGKTTTYSTVTEIEDWGAAITKVVVYLGDSVAKGTIDKNTFSAFVTRSDSRLATPLLESGYREITNAYVSDAQGNPSETGSYATLEMKIGPTVTLGSPLNYDFMNTGFNDWINCSYTITQQKNIVSGTTTISNLVANKCTGQIRSGVDNFVTGKETNDGITLSYAGYSPKADNKKNPLIIWLHGSGEGGTDPTIPISANKAVNFASSEIQAYFGGAYVLAPQCPTFWMQGSNGEFGGANSKYEKSLMSLIKNYVSQNSDIDPNRIYLGGDSNGGYMTMVMLRDYPNYFAAAMPTCEALADNLITDENIQALKNVPIWFTAAKTDTTVAPAKYVVPTYNRLVKAGASNVHFSYFDTVSDTSGLYKKADGTPYEYQGHWSWIYVYNNQCKDTINGKTSTIMQWLAAQSLPTSQNNSSGSGSHHSSGSNVSSVPSTDAGTFVADTTTDVRVNGSYTVKLVGGNGQPPRIVTGTAGVFEVQLIATNGNTYFVKLVAIGQPGKQTGIYLDGAKLFVATVETPVSGLAVKSDTTAPFTVKVGTSYIMKLTAGSRPTLVPGTAGVFRIELVKASGNEYFFRIVPIGKAGASAGLYINSGKSPVTVATVS
ncbi:MAG TPA: glycoside hydrolase family 3 C-terminal domain-containing protein [Caproiciproducens sp.]|nr:glycoside hydrolase family 3 C-terminal domain-containing protein [Caproiciproducens sp.]